MPRNRADVPPLWLIILSFLALCCLFLSTMPHQHVSDPSSVDWESITNSIISQHTIGSQQLAPHP